MAEALKALVPTTGPMLCRDEMEDWSASEANLFEEAIEKYGKDFNDIKKDFLPWKSMRSIIEYFFMWKTTDRYVQQKRIKAMEAENKLKQVFVPAYTNKTTRYCRKLFTIFSDYLCSMIFGNKIVVHMIERNAV